MIFVLVSGCEDSGPVCNDDATQAVWSQAIREKNMGLCEKIKEQSCKDYCVNHAAYAALDPLGCAKIKTADTRDNCYQNMALAKGDGTLCDKMTTENGRQTCHNFVVTNSDGTVEDTAGGSQTTTTLAKKKFVLTGVEGTIRITTPDGKTRIAKEGDIVMDGDVIDGTDGGTAEMSQQGSSTHTPIGSKTLVLLGAREGFEYQWGEYAGPSDGSSEDNQDNVGITDMVKGILFGGPNNSSNIVESVKDLVDALTDQNTVTKDRKMVVHDPEGQIYIRGADGALREARDGDEVGPDERLISLEDSTAKVTFKYTDENGRMIESEKFDLYSNTMVLGSGITEPDTVCTASTGCR